MIKFMSLSSGSCGNCYFLGIEKDGRIEDGIVIDAGVSIRRMKQLLQANGLSENDFSNILITHDHMDHIRSLASYCKRLQKPVYATTVLHNALASHSFAAPFISGCRHDLVEGQENVVGAFRVRYFEVPHDATQTVGYYIEADGHKFMIMTDAGRVTREALEYASQADTVVFESNYDVDMLMGGPYTHELKMRICQGHGHISNDECAEAIRKFYHKGLRNLFLCHLSENNNTPQLAYDSALKALKSIGVNDGDIRLMPLPRRSNSPMMIL